MNYKISVIIPCYNAENTIERAINSIINQSIGFKNIELILYDDASIDDTTKKIKNYSNKYENITHILSKNNVGPGKGRNECINKSSAEYIMFLDSDDEYDEEMCKTLYNEITSGGYDLVSCNYMNQDNISNHIIKMEYLNKKVTKDEKNKVIFNYPNLFYFDNILIWNCIFKRKIILKNNVFFPDIRISEDSYFSNMYKLNSLSICYLKTYVGVYRHVQNNSLSNSLNFNDMFDMHETNIKLLNKLKNNDLNLAYIFKNYIKGSLIRLYITDFLLCPKNDIKNFLNKLHDFELEINFKYSLGVTLNILNFFIRFKSYNLAIIYLNIIRKIFNSNKIRKIYRFFHK